MSIEPPESKMDSRLVELAEVMIKAIRERDPTAGDFVASFTQFRVILTEESDRGCALMAASYIEEQLRVLIAAHLLNDNQLRAKLLTQRGPLATFSARTDIVYGLGLISKDAYRDLNLLRKIRNDFAHTSEPLSFTTEKIAARCRALRLHVGAPISSPRQKFTRTMAALVSEIYISRSKAVSPTPSAPIDSTETLQQIRELAANLRANGWENNPFEQV